MIKNLREFTGLVFSEGIKSAYNFFRYYTPKGCEVFESSELLPVTNSPVLGRGFEVLRIKSRTYLVNHDSNGLPSMMGRVVKRRIRGPLVMYYYKPEVLLNQVERCQVLEQFTPIWERHIPSDRKVDYR